MVRYPGLVEEGRALGVEKMRLERQEAEALHRGRRVRRRVIDVRAFPYLGEELFDGFVEVVSVLRRLGEERHGLEVAQVIEPVGAPEDVVRDVSRAALEVLEVLS